MEFVEVEVPMWKKVENEDSSMRVWRRGEEIDILYCVLGYEMAFFKSDKKNKIVKLLFKANFYEMLKECEKEGEIPTLPEENITLPEKNITLPEN
jgi:hypothetical protein